MHANGVPAYKTICSGDIGWCPRCQNHYLHHSADRGEEFVLGDALSSAIRGAAVITPPTEKQVTWIVSQGECEQWVSTYSYLVAWLPGLTAGASWPIDETPDKYRTQLIMFHHEIANFDKNVARQYPFLINMPETSILPANSRIWGSVVEFFYLIWWPFHQNQCRQSSVGLPSRIFRYRLIIQPLG